VLTERTPAAVAVLTLAEMDPFGDDACPDPALRLGVSDRCRDDGVIFNSAV
jgi:hypothetical protein